MLSPALSNVVSPNAVESWILRFLDERGHNHPSKATTHVLRTTDLDVPYENRDGSLVMLDAAHVEEAIDESLDGVIFEDLDDMIFDYRWGAS